MESDPIGQANFSASNKRWYSFSFVVKIKLADPMFIKEGQFKVKQELYLSLALKMLA